jgi:hypothetical protein
MNSPCKEDFVYPGDYERWLTSDEPGAVFVVKPEFFERGERSRTIPKMLHKRSGPLFGIARTLITEDDFLPAFSKVEFDEL